MTPPYNFCGYIRKNAHVRGLNQSNDMGKIKRMDQVKAILQTYLRTKSIKATARQLKTSKNTVRHYLRLGQAYDEDLSKVLSLSDEAFNRVFYETENEEKSDREKVFSDQVAYWRKELGRVGVTRRLLWEEYRVEHEQGYGYSQFCERLRREIGHRDLTIAMKHKAGEVMMLDFAGKKLHWVDAYTGEVHECEILVAVFPYSQYTFVIALESQKMEDFIYGLTQALLFFGALCQVILSDNLRSYVSRSDRYEPTFTQLCEQLGAHYQIDLQATRVGKPKDKASVENAVGQAYRRIYAPLRNDIFHSREELNEAIRKQLALHNAKAYQKKEGSRREVFQNQERPQMRDLPSDSFEIKKITSAKIQANYHVFLGEEKNYYSVPYQYFPNATRAQVVYTSRIVEVFLNGRRIAIHARLPGRGTYHYQTQDSHMPEKHRQWKKTQGYDSDYFLEQARKIGPATHWAIQHILLSRIHEQQAYNSCLGVLRLAGRFSNERLEQAALRCQQVQKASYGMLERILKRNLDQATDQADTVSLPQHDNIRGADNYQ